jgi:precorrin-6B C5,15-methyltransferase / cobalt-precorrin-6B C5,C15-methyltransferase
MLRPWLSIIGLGEDGLAGLSDASRAALHAAETVFGAPRHLDLAQVGTKGRAWPVPFDLAPLLALRGQPVALLASGDPFWHGAGGSVTAHLTSGEWQAFPAPGIFSLIAARMGWRLEQTICLGLHAAPFARLRPVLARGVRAICTLRDGAAVGELVQWLADNGFAQAEVTVCEAMGGPRERLRRAPVGDAIAPVAVAIDGTTLPRNAGLPRASGLPDDSFAHDGQITKRAIRALTLSTLAPRPGALLWDIGGGSGSISIEWCLASGRAITLETRADRVANIKANIAAFGLTAQMQALLGTAPQALATLAKPDAVFIGGGGNAALYAALFPLLAPGTRLVANGVTLESESTLAALHAQHGGTLLRIDLAEAQPLGTFRGWSAARPVVQWSVTL